MSATLRARRIAMDEMAPRLFAALIRLEDAIELDPRVRELVRVRASQINGCAFCIDMHWKDARAEGESEDRLYSLDAWRESPLYSDRERAALELCEAITLIADSHVPDDILEEAPAGGTRISFRFEWLRAPLIGRLAAPLTRSVLRRGNQRSLERLAQRLTLVPQL